MISFYTLSTRFFLERKILSDARRASITKKDYGFSIRFLQRFMKSLRSISGELLNAICRVLVCLGFS